ncbi:uncharacterized protein TNIN_348371 [Trichonephila inaurata madagascariensis]|uniref:Uncharacterized protein n=1 Tax=Trichonephila inaurata madagascariensis TaxID=2747483 RepID=A0A8X7CRI6_9ARAC|nr:uncharacterized protein TNIN_348371 [Trichonephila inaurata madagascariensis]
MAAIDVDASFRSLENCFEKLENVLKCAGNPSKKLREDARTALGKLKSYISNAYDGSADLKNSDVVSASFVKLSYASIVAPSIFENAKHSLNNVIVCANENNFTSEEVRQIIRTELNPRKIQVGVKKMRTINKNRVLVQCVTKEDKDRFLTAINEKTNTLQVSSPRKRNPNVLLKNLPNVCVKLVTMKFSSF